jgi:hypothetical protein
VLCAPEEGSFYVFQQSDRSPRPVLRKQISGVPVFKIGSRASAFVE